MLYSMFCVGACVSRGRAEQAEKVSLAGHPILVITNGHVFQQRARLVRTRTFGQPTLAKYWVDEGSVTDG